MKYVYYFVGFFYGGKIFPHNTDFVLDNRGKIWYNTHLTRRGLPPLINHIPVIGKKMSSNFVIDSTKKEIMSTLIKGGKSCLITGATGAGKTTFCYSLAEELKMNPVVINCGSTQDARTSLLGYFTLEDGNTKFQESDFLKAIQKPNTLIILDELSRASDDAYNIIFPILDFRRNIRVDEMAEGHEVEVDSTVRFIATANVGIEYSATRTIDRALQDRFMIFNLPYMTKKEMKSYITKQYDKETAVAVEPLLEIYAYTHKMFGESKISSRLSTRAVLDCLPLVTTFSMKDIMETVILSQFSQDSSSIINDANIIREYADSIGIYN
tara:strand:- start:1971 stop:2945 length:975 start_codon:yes stop_codon:yes gene_type:complete